MAPGSPLGERILEAATAEGRKVGNVEAALGMTRGHLGRMVRGQRASETLDVELFWRMAKLLHVEFQWLVLGEGSMRRGGRGTTPAEEAIRFARENGAREDAVQAAWERNKDREQEMTTWDWVNAINAEAQRLTGVPRPEAVDEHRRAVGRTKTRLDRAKKRAERELEDAAKKKRSAGTGLRVAGGK